MNSTGTGVFFHHTVLYLPDQAANQFGKGKGTTELFETIVLGYEVERLVRLSGAENLVIFDGVS